MRIVPLSTRQSCTGTCCRGVTPLVVSRQRFFTPWDTRRRVGDSSRLTFEISICAGTSPSRATRRMGGSTPSALPLVGPAGSLADVVSVWVVRTGEEVPRFVTAYPEVGG